MKYLENLDYVLIWRIFLGLAVASTLVVIAYEEVKTTVTYTYTPTGENRFIKKRYDNPNDSPIVLREGKRWQLINQPSTPFTATLTDIFEDLTIRVWYQSPNPTSLSISSDKSSTPQLVDPDKVSIYERLEEKGWAMQENIIPNHTELVLYTNPGKPAFFGSFDTFWGQVDAVYTVEQIYAGPSVFVVKGDGNVQHQSLFDKHDLNFIQYILLPRSLDVYAQHGAHFIEKAGQNLPKGTYQLELSEKLWEEVRKRGAKYNFRLNLNNFSSGDWATVEKIKITATRKPVTLESLKNFLGRKLPI